MRILLKAPTDPGFREMVIPSGDTDKELKLLQDLVGGYIETVTLETDCCIICNEEGRIPDKDGKPRCEFNCTFCGIDFVGTILIVGVDGDRLTSAPMSVTMANGGIEQ